MKKFTTINDIAEALGISKSTVSRALADRFDVRPETRQAVLDMAKQMNYRPNLYARNLISRRSKIIGVVVPEFTNSFFPRVIIQIQKVFEANGFNVLITQSNESAEIERRNLELLERSMVEGIIISVAQNEINVDYYNELTNRGIPMVFFNRVSQSVDASKVVIDDYKMSFFAVEHLILNNGAGNRKRIMHLRGPKDISSSSVRCRGYTDALKKYNIEYSPELVVECNHITRMEGFRVMNESIERGVVPDAIFAFNDQLAIGAMKALGKKGLRIPEDISVMGFSESQSALLVEPSLSSVAQPLDEMGQTAANLLLERIKNPSAKNTIVVLDAIINIRGSSDMSKKDETYL